MPEFQRHRVGDAEIISIRDTWASKAPLSPAAISHSGAWERS